MEASLLSHPLAPDDARRGRLAAIIERESLMRGHFVLSSGRESTYLFQLRQTMLHPEGASLLGDVIVDYMQRQGLSSVGGLAMGAVPLVSAVAVASFSKGYPVRAFFVRKEAKGHGAKERIDGHIAKGSEVLVVDDVTTTGGSTIKAVEAIREEGGCTVTRALSIVDREEGASEELARHGIALVSLFKRTDFLPD
ncbi:MAG: orotate phosphoribosyltransferase [Parvibaculaceae bacterium]